MKSILPLAALLVAVNANAHLKTETAEYRFAGDMEYSSFCKAVVENDLDLFKRTISNKVGTLAGSRKDVVRKLVSEDGMTCNGANLVEFSMQREASDVHAYLTEQF